MQEFPYFHPYPSVSVLTWVAEKYPSWLADVGLSCLPYIVTPSLFAQKLMPVVTFITFVLWKQSTWIFYCSTCVFPIICTLTVSTLTLLMSSDVNSASLSSDHSGHIDMSVVLFQIAEEREKELQRQQEEREQTNAALKKAKEEQAPKTFKAGVGKYINPATMWGHTIAHALADLLFILHSM